MSKHRFVRLPVYDLEVSLTHPAPKGALEAMVTAFDSNYGPHGITESMMAVYNALMKYGEPVKEQTNE